MKIVAKHVNMFGAARQNAGDPWSLSTVCNGLGVGVYDYTLVLEDALADTVHGGTGRVDLALYFWEPPPGSRGPLTVIPSKRDEKQKATVSDLRSRADARGGTVPSVSVAIIEFKVRDVPATELRQQLTGYV